MNFIKKHLRLVPFLFLSILVFFSALPVLADVYSYTPLAPLPGFEKEVKTNDENGIISYIQFLYKLGVGLATALAVIFVIWGGIEYMTTDAIGGKEEGKQKIQNAIFGLLLALGSYAILYTLSPDFVNVSFKNVKDISGQTGKLVENSPSYLPLGKTAEDMRGAGEIASAESDPNFNTFAYLNADGTITMDKIRSTFYYSNERNSDPDTDAGRSSTGVPLRYGDANTVGIAAVDPRVIPYGSIISIDTNQGKRVFIAADTGGGVVSRKPSSGGEPVIDFYSKSQVGSEYSSVKVVKYQGPDFTKLSGAQKAKVIEDAQRRYIFDEQ